jgi:hypothetical protein
MRLSENKRFLGVLVFLGSITYPLAQLIWHKQPDLTTLLLTVIGFFAFIVADHFQQAETIGKLEATVKELTNPRVKPMSYIDALNYCCEKVKSARRMYNTSFSVDIHALSPDYYNRWIQSIVEAITDHKCNVIEVLLFEERYKALCNEFTNRGKPQRASYTGIDLSSDREKLRAIPLIEIVLFDYGDNKREVIFGWAVSSSDSLGTDCFRVQDEQVVKYFESYFNQLTSLGKKINLPPHHSGKSQMISSN